MPTTPALAIEGLTVRYGDTLAVDGLDLRIDPGETVALLGPNGAGKSSTVNAALGLFRPAAGRIRLHGRPPAEAVRAGGVGAMLQHGGLPSEAGRGHTVVFATHHLEEADAVADRVVVVAAGRIARRRHRRLDQGADLRSHDPVPLPGTPGGPGGAARRHGGRWRQRAGGARHRRCRGHPAGAAGRRPPAARGRGLSGPGQR